MQVSCLDESVLIVFIDYGNSESKSPNEIYPLIESLARLPAMTVACTLNEVAFFLSNIFFRRTGCFRPFQIIKISGHQKQQMHLMWSLKIVLWKFTFNKPLVHNGK